ncbi:hypothetical protein E2I00_017810, partial [Balaenoptera physalus]
MRPTDSRRTQSPISGTAIKGPSIVTPPKDIWNVTGAQVYLSCEVIGIPTPVLIWNKVSGPDFTRYPRLTGSSYAAQGEVGTVKSKNATGGYVPPGLQQKLLMLLIAYLEVAGLIQGVERNVDHFQVDDSVQRTQTISPPPRLFFLQVKRGHYGVQRTELLPGDRDNLAIQTRGGPEKHEVTGWVLVSPLSKEDAGEYECHASNSQGQASASAKITVVDALHEIPVKKG